MKKVWQWALGVVGVIAVAGVAVAGLLAWQGARTETPTAMAPAPVEPSRAEQILAGMTLEEKIGQMFVVSTADLATGTRGQDVETELDEVQQANLVRYAPGGVALFDGNIRSAAQLAQYVADLQTNSKYGLLIATDQEGGIVDRLARIGVTRFGNMATIGASGDVTQAYHVGATYGREMKALGLNVDFAPVADVNTNPRNPVIGVRAFGSDADVVSGMVAEEVKGLQANGVVATLKHFPGHGDTATDTHTGMAVVGNDLARLRLVELVPFRAGIVAGADLVLTAHIKLPNVDPSGLPATMSKVVVTDLLRGELGFSGVVITDALDMAAISDYYTPIEVVTNCVAAGVDILLMPKQYFVMHEAFVQLVRDGTISEERVEESALRIVELKLKYGVME
jgi:beta-N-acetylhexosaminidase